jgi:hypothetical protein
MVEEIVECDILNYEKLIGEMLWLFKFDLNNYESKYVIRTKGVIG